METVFHSNGEEKHTLTCHYCSKEQSLEGLKLVN
jgi:hypothetical protein